MPEPQTESQEGEPSLPTPMPKQESDGFRDTIEYAATDPSWPPLPTMSGSEERPQLSGERISVQPRGVSRDLAVGKGGLPPRKTEIPTATPQAPVKVEASARPFDFGCPACGGGLISTIGNRDATPGPCPHCGVAVVAPHIVGSEPQPEKREYFRPDRARATNDPLPSKRIR